MPRSFGCVSVVARSSLRSNGFGGVGPRPARTRPRALLPPRGLLRAGDCRLGGGEPGQRHIKEPDRSQERPSEVVAADAISGWLDTPNEAFRGLKPLEVIERGEIDRLWDMNFYLESGVASWELLAGAFATGSIRASDSPCGTILRPEPHGESLDKTLRNLFK
jgi:hypothetical protein